MNGLGIFCEQNFCGMFEKGQLDEMVKLPIINKFSVR